MKFRKHHYSGNNSRKFWKEISKIKNEELHSELYGLGVILQNLEEYILNRLKKVGNDKK